MISSGGPISAVSGGPIPGGGPISAVSGGTGGTMTVGIKGGNGVSNTISGGGASGVNPGIGVGLLTTIRLPQRPRIRLVPSVNIISPLVMRTGCAVQ
jgi:hypothetical protein